MAQVVWSSWPAQAGDTACAMAQDKTAFLVTSAAYVIVSVAIMVLTLASRRFAKAERKTPQAVRACGIGVERVT
jgi:hypothetical protein